MAKKKVSKPLNTEKLQKRYERVMEGFGPLEPEVPELRAIPNNSPGIVVVRDYVTYSAYEDPIEG